MWFIFTQNLAMGGGSAAMPIIVPIYIEPRDASLIATTSVYAVDPRSASLIATSSDYAVDPREATLVN